MRLSKLTLSGFKSFADRTEFTFDEAITGVVGPNGCGKSNIVDAIKWVLGERSSKSLRGKEMIDVIFAGSAGRKPSGMASVTLTFDNPVVDASASMVELVYGDNPEEGPETCSPGCQPDDAAPIAVDETAVSPPAMQNVPRSRRRGLPIESDIVEVERRLYRDGTSKYLINGKNARLRDIRDLFLDTGIGADAYSIIEQGKVDAMLLASPQERRTIFEEAAGIARYKQRRIEAQRKLDRAQANLTLTREQLANTERRLRIVRSQAVKARRFKELDEELRAVRMALAFDQYDDVRQRLDGLTSRLAELESVRDNAAQQLAALEAAKQEAEVARHELLTEHKNLEERRLAAKHAEQTAIQRKSMTERALEDARRQSEADEARLAGLQQRITSLLNAKEEQHQLIASVSEQLAEAERDVTRAAQERAALLEVRAERQAALADRRATVANIDRERAALLASIEADVRREESLRDQILRVEERRTALEVEITRIAAANDEAQRAVKARSTAIASLEATLTERDAAAASLSQGRGELSQRISTLEQHMLRLDSRRAMLREMEEGRIGLGEAVRSALELRNSGEAFRGVIAPLADLIDADMEHAAAIEAALGTVLQSLVVPSISTMPPVDELSRLTGRVMFLPLSGLNAAGLPSNVPTHDLSSLTESNRAVPLCELVRLRNDIGCSENVGRDLLDRLLGNAWLVPDLDSAMLLAAIMPAARFVTRDGHVMEPDGRIHAGPLSGAGGEPAGLLQRRGELAGLEIELARQATLLEAERLQLQAVDAEAAELASRQAELRSLLAAEQRALVSDQAKVEQIAVRTGHLIRDRENLDDEIGQLHVRLHSAETDRQGLKDRAQRLSGLHHEQLQIAASIEAELQEVQCRAEAHSEQLASLRVECTRLGEQLAAARREHRRLEAAAEAAERESRDLANLVEQSRARLADHERAITESCEQIEQSRAEAERLQGEVDAVEASMHETDERARQLGEDVGTARQHAQRVERDWHSLEVARRELEVKRENLEERTLEELDIALDQEYRAYRRMMDTGDVTRIDQASAAAEIDELRAHIRRLGNVNLEAIDEENALEARNEELIRQVADIDEAARKLSELINTLNAASRERFGEVFGRIQEHFAGQNGMFRKLFGGGRAEVRLMPLVREVETPEGLKKVETDEIDLLESGIEVIAKPPGKEPRSISQLSGGEKTLTAVALLLAIFQSKPSCFCVLDEVDAALDDANVGRYCAVVREFTTHSHFIVITHNKKTMQAADRLYGITMQERGVSTRVSVKFEQVGRDGEIAGDGAGPAPSVKPAARGKLSAQASPEVITIGADAPVHANGIPQAVNGHPTAGDSAAEVQAKPKSDLLRRALAGMRETGDVSVES